MRWQKQYKILLVHINADHWKSKLHQGLSIPDEEQGAVVLFRTANDQVHKEWAEHITAEVQKETWIEGRGTAIVWERISRKNHFLDTAYIATCASHYVRREIDRLLTQKVPIDLAALGR